MGITFRFTNTWITTDSLFGLEVRTRTRIMKVTVAILLALAILLPLMGSVDAQSRRRRSGLVAYRTRQLRALRARQMQMLRMRALHRRRRNRRIPPWVYFKTPNEKGERKIE